MFYQNSSDIFKRNSGSIVMKAQFLKLLCEIFVKTKILVISQLQETYQKFKTKN